MKLRLFAVILIAVFLSVSAAVAKQAGPAAQPNGAGKCFKQLGLSSDQVQQIRGIVKQYFSDVRGVFKSDIPKEEKRTKVKALKQQASDAIMALLTPEQQDKATKLNLIDRLLSPRKHRAMAIRKALAQLDLSADQKAQIKAIFGDTRASAKNIRQDPNLDATAKKAQLQALHKETRDKIISVLTPEQQQKLKQIMANRRQPGS